MHDQKPEMKGENKAAQKEELRAIIRVEGELTAYISVNPGAYYDEVEGPAM